MTMTEWTKEPDRRVIRRYEACRELAYRRADQMADEALYL